MLSFIKSLKHSFQNLHEKERENVIFNQKNFNWNKISKKNWRGDGDGEGEREIGEEALSHSAERHSV